MLSTPLHQGIQNFTLMVGVHHLSAREVQKKSNFSGKNV